jgi:hypothetical protein
MRTVAATRQTPRPDLTSAPKALTWLVYCRENKLLTASEWASAAILVTLGPGPEHHPQRRRLATVPTPGMRRGHSQARERPLPAPVGHFYGINLSPVTALTSQPPAVSTQTWHLMRRFVCSQRRGSASSGLK